MSIQVYECKKHGQVEVLIRSLDIPPTRVCSKCGLPMPNVISAPAIVDVRRTWNDKANDYRHDPYTQAKAQLRNLDRENQEHQGTRPMKITEPMLQEAAKRIDEDNRRPVDPLAVPKRAHRMQRRARQQTQV